MIRASSTLSLIVAAVVLVASGAAASGCGANEGENEAQPASPCVAFAKASPLVLSAELGRVPARVASVSRIARGAGHTYALAADKTLGRLDAEAAQTLVVPLALDFAVARSAAGVVHAFVARWTRAEPASLSFELTRYTSPDDGLTFDAASAVSLLAATTARVETGTPETASLGFGADGLLYVALGDAGPSTAGLDSIFGKVLRLDVSGEVAVAAPGNPVPAGQGRPEIWAIGIHRPAGLDVDATSGAVWLTDSTAAGDATLVHRIVRGSTDALVPIATIAAVEKRVAFAGGHVARGRRVPGLAGKYVYPARDAKLVAVDAFGPSGTSQSSLLHTGVDGPLGRIEDDDLVVATERGVAVVVETTPSVPAARSLLGTKCFDLAAPSGVPTGAIAYDVTTPLWSDGATKDRFVVVPPGGAITARADGDLVFPVGTVAVKTFAVDGRRVETRLLVQHELEDWVGYSYAWNDEGTDAELVIGNRSRALPGGKSWYFPSSADCTACHTPAAGYTLGLEAKQLAGHGDALTKLAARASTSLEPAGAALVAVDALPPATNEARARSYLHANCATCHREGSATGTVVDLDLRIDTPLEKTGLCKEAQAGTVGLATGARIIAPHEPAASVLVARMRALDERRMPKLASHVVDEAGVAAVEAWIRELTSCP